MIPLSHNVLFEEGTLTLLVQESDLHYFKNDEGKAMLDVRVVDEDVSMEEIETPFRILFEEGKAFVAISESYLPFVYDFSTERLRIQVVPDGPVFSSEEDPLPLSKFSSTYLGNIASKTGSFVIVDPGKIYYMWDSLDDSIKQLIRMMRGYVPLDLKEQIKFISSSDYGCASLHDGAYYPAGSFVSGDCNGEVKVFERHYEGELRGIDFVFSDEECDEPEILLVGGVSVDSGSIFFIDQSFVKPDEYHCDDSLYEGNGIKFWGKDQKVVKKLLLGEGFHVEDENSASVILDKPFQEMRTHIRQLCKEHDLFVVISAYPKTDYTRITKVSHGGGGIVPFEDETVGFGYVINSGDGYYTVYGYFKDKKLLKASLVFGQ